MEKGNLNSKYKKILEDLEGICCAEKEKEDDTKKQMFMLICKGFSIMGKDVEKRYKRECNLFPYTWDHLKKLK